MELKDLLSEKNEELYKEITNTCKVFLKKNNDDDNVSWKVEYKDTYANIYYSESQHPEEAFVHELLHIYIQIKGYHKPHWIIPKDNMDKLDLLSKFVSIPLDNELQHHKMFKKYLELGYNADYFYNDNDQKEVREHILEFINGRIDDNIYMLTQYLTVIAPFGEKTFDNLEEIKSQIKNKSDLDFKRLCENVENRIIAWQNDDTYNNETVIKDIISYIPFMGNFCIKYNDNFIKQDKDIFRDLPFKYKCKINNGEYEIKFL